jgi:hypothetical protein
MDAAPHAEGGAKLVRMQAIAALGTVEIDFGTGAVSVSDEARRLLGWDSAQVPSVALILQSVHEDDAPRSTASRRSRNASSASPSMSIAVR